MRNYCLRMLKIWSDILWTRFTFYLKSVMRFDIHHHKNFSPVIDVCNDDKTFYIVWNYSHHVIVFYFAELIMLKINGWNF